MTLAAGTHLGRYEIRSKLGAAEWVKYISRATSKSVVRLQRFQQEACAAGALNHPNILSIYDVGKHDGSPYVVSELLEGETLRTRISGTPLSPRPSITRCKSLMGSLRHTRRE